MDIKQYLDSEGILDVKYEDLEKSLSDEDKMKINEAEKSMEYFPYNYDFKVHQDFYNTQCQIRINGIPIIIPLTGIFRNEIEQTTPVILEHIKDDRLILDAGCGFGYKTKFYGINVEGRVIGLDMNKAELNIGNQRKNNNMSYLRGDVFKLPFRDNLFDSVLFCNAIQEDGIFYGSSNYYYEYMNEKIKELSRVVKPKGKVIVSHNGYDDYPEMIIYNMEKNGIVILKNYDFKHTINYDKEFENHVHVGVKK